MASEPEPPDPDDWAADERRARRDRRSDRSRGGRRLSDENPRASLLAKPAAQLAIAVLIVAVLVLLIVRAF